MWENSRSNVLSYKSVFKWLHWAILCLCCCYTASERRTVLWWEWHWDSKLIVRLHCIDHYGDALSHPVWCANKPFLNVGAIHTGKIILPLSRQLFPYLNWEEREWKVDLNCTVIFFLHNCLQYKCLLDWLCWPQITSWWPMNNFTLWTERQWAILAELSSASLSYWDYLLSCTELQMYMYLDTNDTWFSVCTWRVGCCFEEITFFLCGERDATVCLVIITVTC